MCSLHKRREISGSKSTHKLPTILHRRPLLQKEGTTGKTNPQGPRFHLHETHSPNLPRLRPRCAHSTSVGKSQDPSPRSSCQQSFIVDPIRICMSHISSAALELQRTFVSRSDLFRLWLNLSIFVRQHLDQSAPHNQRSSSH